MPEKRWDAFISHASEDKKGFVLPLAEALRDAGFELWLDDWRLEVGTSLRKSIEVGLSQSRFAVVVLSPSFFKKKWPQEELSALVSGEDAEARVILPVWYEITHEEVARQAPLLLDRVAAKAEDGLPEVVAKLSRTLVLGTGREFVRDSNAVPVTWETLTSLTLELYPGFEIGNFWQTQLLANLDQATFRSIQDIRRAVARAKPAVDVFARECPDLFHTGTDYITKSLGFVDLAFRARHNFGTRTRNAFVEHAAKVDWNRT